MYDLDITVTIFQKFGLAGNGFIGGPQPCGFLR